MSTSLSDTIVTSPNQRKRVYPITEDILTSDVWNMNIKNEWVAGRPDVPTQDKRRRRGEKHLFQRIKINRIGSKGHIEVARLKPSIGSWYSPVTLFKQTPDQKDDKFNIYAKNYKMKPAIFDKEMKQFNKQQQQEIKISQSDAQPTIIQPQESIIEDIPDNSDGDSSYSHLSPQKNPNRLQSKQTLNKIKKQTQPLQYTQIKGELQAIKKVLKLHSKNDSKIAKAMKYITLFEGEYKHFGLEPTKWKYIQQQFDRVTKASFSNPKHTKSWHSKNRRKKKIRKRNNFNNLNNKYLSSSDNENNMCNHSDCDSVQCLYDMSDDSDASKCIGKTKKSTKKESTNSESNSTSSEDTSGEESSEESSDGDIAFQRQYCNICKKLIRNEEIMQHYKRHKKKHKNKYNEHQCRYNLTNNLKIQCLKTFPNDDCLTSHEFSQHSSQKLSLTIIKNVFCAACGGKTTPSWDGRSDEWKKLCKKCGKKRVCANEIEQASLDACILTTKEVLEKYPLPHEISNNKAKVNSKQNDENKDKTLGKTVDKNKTGDKNESQNSNNNNNNNISGLCIDGAVHNFDLQQKNNCVIWGCIRCGKISQIIK